MTQNLINLTKPIPTTAGGTRGSGITTTNGTVYYAASALQTIDPGTAGQLLCSNGLAVPPSMQTKSGSTPSFQLLSTQTVTSVSSLTFTQISSDYQTYYLTSVGTTILLTANPLGGQFSTDGGSTWVATNYSSSRWRMDTTLTTITVLATTTWFNLATYYLDTGGLMFATAWMYNMGISAYPVVVANGINNYNGATQKVFSGSQLNTLGTYNAFQILAASGGLFSGTFSLYGVKQ